MRGHVLDLGANGMAIVVASNLAAGTGLSVQFILPDKVHGHQAIEVGAKVAYNMFNSELGGFQLGLGFVRVADADQAAIERFVHE